MPSIPTQKPLDIFFRIILASIIILWCFYIARPFLVLLIWSGIIAVALYPLFGWVKKKFKGRKVLTATSMILFLLTVFVLPSVQIGHSLTKTAKELKRELNANEINFEEPPAKVAEWPLIGDQVYSIWNEAASNLPSFIEHYKELISNVGARLLKSILGIMTDLVISIIAIIIAGALMVYGESIYQFMERFSQRLIGDRGHEYVVTARDTIVSVVKGILLIALVQAVLAFVGFAVAGLPAAGLWAILILIAAIVQLPVLIITIPIIIYGFSFMDTTPAIIFAIYTFAIGLIDNILKPVLLGRGLETPMLVILIGALGGLAAHGIIGLFVGPVVLSIGYRSLMLWIGNNDTLS